MERCADRRRCHRRCRSRSPERKPPERDWRWSSLRIETVLVSARDRADRPISSWARDSRCGLLGYGADGLVAQLASQDLADVGFRQVVAKLDVAQPLVAGQLLDAEGEHDR